MKRKQNLVLAIVLTTAAGILTLQNFFTPASNSATQTPSAREIATDPPISETCAYVWAYHDAPALTEKVNGTVKELNSKAYASASLYGEDCIYADGHSTFGAMETNFHIHLGVDDLTNEEALGNWITQVMPSLIEIPSGEIQGHYGFVEFWFEKNETEWAFVRVPIQKYMDEAQGKTGAELFRMFSGTP